MFLHNEVAPELHMYIYKTPKGTKQKEIDNNLP